LVCNASAADAIAAPRIHDQWVPDRLTVEPTVPADVVEALRGLGHTVEASGTVTAVQMIRVRDDGTIEAAADPRKARAK
jgi:gamma-glutamyltranspeptidase/glutathione hydrolase